jgi:hypothetical protein
MQSGLCGRCYLSEAQDPIPPLLTHCILVYSRTVDLFTQERGGE